MASPDPVGRIDLSTMERRLQAAFCPPLHPPDVNRCVIEAFLQFDDARVRGFLAILVERMATERLRALAADSEGEVVSGSVDDRTAPPQPVVGAREPITAARVTRREWSRRVGRRRVVVGGPMETTQWKGTSW